MLPANTVHRPLRCQLFPDDGPDEPAASAALGPRRCLTCGQMPGSNEQASAAAIPALVAAPAEEALEVAERLSLSTRAGRSPQLRPAAEVEAARAAASASSAAADRTPRAKVLRPPPPARGCLRRAGQQPRPSADVRVGSATGRSAQRVTFCEAGEKRALVENFGNLGEELWYPGYMVECDQCEEPVEWGAEGTMTGASGRSRFSQWQVLCNTCVSDRLLAEVGVWFIVALAATCTGSAGGQHDESVRVAEGPLLECFDKLLQLPPGAQPDQLTALLGKEAEVPEVRATVLRKARLRVPYVLGRPIKSEPAEEASEAAGASAGSGQPERGSTRGGSPGSKKAVKATKGRLQRGRGGGEGEQADHAGPKAERPNRRQKRLAASASASASEAGAAVAGHPGSGPAPADTTAAAALVAGAPRPGRKRADCPAKLGTPAAKAASSSHQKPSPPCCLPRSRTRGLARQVPCSHVESALQWR